MGIHALWTGLWLILGIVGWCVAAFAGMVWGVWYVEKADVHYSKPTPWGLAVTPVCWLIGTSWAMFALVQAILEFIAAVTALGPSL